MPHNGLAPFKESIRHEIYVLHHSYKAFYLTATHEFTPVIFFLAQDTKGIECTTVQRIFSEGF